jgi:nitroreductase
MRETQEAVLDAIRNRRSVGRSEGEPPQETIRELVRAATWAPNHHLTEPWTFTVVRGEARSRLGEFWAKTRADELGLAGEKRDGFITAESQKLLRAPVLLIVSTRTDPDPVVATEDFAATAAAVQNVLLAASTRGLCAMWRTGDMVYHASVKRYLGLDESERIVATIYLGERAAKEAQPQSRKEPPIRWLE